MTAVERNFGPKSTQTVTALLPGATLRVSIVSSRMQLSRGCSTRLLTAPEVQPHETRGSLTSIGTDDTLIGSANGSTLEGSGGIGTVAAYTLNGVTVDLADGTASVSLILIDAAGEKSIATKRGAGLTRVLPDNADALVRNIDALLVDNRFPDFVTAIARAARRRNIPVVIDFDQATKPDHPLLALGTHVIASSEALHGTTGTRDFAAGLAQLAAHNSGLLAVTNGENGVYWRDGDVLRHMPAFAVTAVDTLGAGDAFHGAFTLALADGRDLGAALRFACAAAALKCTRFGGAAGAPFRADVDAFIAARPAS